MKAAEYLMSTMYLCSS